MTSIVALTAVAVVVLGFLSVWWTTRRSRSILRKALGRPLQNGEEISLRSWMQVSDQELDSAGAELKRDPFDEVLRNLDAPRAADGSEDIIRMRPPVYDSSSTLWALTRDGDVASCETQTGLNGTEIRVMRNGTLVWSRSFIVRDDALREADAERARMVSAGWLLRGR